ncbi:MAG: UDP-N-acetylenolpyruvoylglucosamine reductase [Acidobacteria bacterium]|jgi:UDP-N-acetylmuramate dehydrogenase|nr:MAG: UDP-N-acetylenolpyruvoylglucosamine reductase [Acidobacteriota bacterium]
MNVQENVSLAPLTTMKVGGPARYFVENKTIAEVQGAVAFGRSRNLPLFVLGGGSNLVVSDAGWPGLVLKVGITGIDERNENGKAIFDVGAGEEWDKFAARAVARNCAGVECLSGIPGSVGGTPVQNVGAYGQEAAETIESVLTLDLRDDQIRELCGEACGFSYRTSIFNTSERGCYIILRVTYGLTPGGQPRIDYADLKRHFSGWQQIPTLADTREAVRRIRASKAMLITPGDADARSVGSFFKNPVLSSEQHEDLSRRAAARGLQIPSYPALDAQHKISAAWLVEHSGFSKGYDSGHVAISSKHALAIVNRGGATAADVVALKEHIQHRVQEIWSICLQPEPVFVGF